ncbi:hypothetical protein BO70DRAFT_395123 [Aspergillus heteromorphus CBS 117.55]|uniref:Uncharacterized protein n=1 Tax=Aspergillus heteromorphus CBS 117.55 TaxID=1448321 RepID=A0A317WHN2_9EURO|nr:uncharacterized protein BO70DRAFT_395123 [Aspergillus heteromorphus CBS 117.55]PWY85994.1 hypothetical protein BO70DRAFT_395123 [Aspergillus heteromorphus CBS 117.55]
MADESKMHQAINATTVILEAALETSDLKEYACELLGAKHVQYEQGQLGFCYLIKLGAYYTLTAGTFILQQGVCDENGNCAFLLEVALRMVGGLVGRALPSVCTAVFEELWSSCNGSIGGTAQISMTGSQTGTYPNDSVVTCPAWSAGTIGEGVAWNWSVLPR